MTLLLADRTSPERKERAVPTLTARSLSPVGSLAAQLARGDPEYIGNSALKFESCRIQMRRDACQELDAGKQPVLLRAGAIRPYHPGGNHLPAVRQRLPRRTEPH